MRKAGAHREFGLARDSGERVADARGKEREHDEKGQKPHVGLRRFRAPILR